MNTSTRKGLCDALGANVFDYGQKAAADQMRTTWEKITDYVGTTYAQDICNELQNKSTVILDQPTHTAAVLQRNAAREAAIRAGQLNIQAAQRLR
jgi:protein-disulfide isomerase-like protein with CxxC motif